MTYRIGSSNAR